MDVYNHLLRRLTGNYFLTVNIYIYICVLHMFDFQKKFINFTSFVHESWNSSLCAPKQVNVRAFFACYANLRLKWNLVILPKHRIFHLRIFLRHQRHQKTAQTLQELLSDFGFLLKKSRKSSDRVCTACVGKVQNAHELFCFIKTALLNREEATSKTVEDYKDTENHAPTDRKSRIMMGCFSTRSLDIISCVFVSAVPVKASTGQA